jgi:hypothetical protein
VALEVNTVTGYRNGERGLGRGGLNIYIKRAEGRKEGRTREDKIDDIRTIIVRDTGGIIEK